MVPISLVAHRIETRIVSSRIASATIARVITPSGGGVRKVTSKPSFWRRLHGSSTALCSWAAAMMWPRPFVPSGPFAYMRAAPLIARLFDSVEPLVQTISFGEAPISAAACSRARSTASSASQPTLWFWLAVLPTFSVKYGSIASTTRGSVRVVAALSM